MIYMIYFWAGGVVAASFAIAAAPGKATLRSVIACLCWPFVFPVGAIANSREEK